MLSSKLANNMGEGEPMPLGKNRQAMAYRAKHRAFAKKLLPLYRLGVHPQNRAGQHPTPTTVVGLGNELMNKGWNKNEANQ